MNGGETGPELVLTLSQIKELYDLDDYWVYSLAGKGRIRQYRLLGKSRPYYSEPDVKDVVEAMNKLGRAAKKLRAFFGIAA